MRTIFERNFGEVGGTVHLLSGSMLIWDQDEQLFGPPIVRRCVLESQRASAGFATRFLAEQIGKGTSFTRAAKMLKLGPRFSA